MDRYFGQLQRMDQAWAWAAATMLPYTSAELRRNAAFRGLASELGADLGPRSTEDEALLIIAPDTWPTVHAYYAGRGRALHELIDSVSIRTLDRWLADEVCHWGRRWCALDPTRKGTAPSTRMALDMVAQELHSRRVPTDVARVLARITRRPTPRRFKDLAAAVRDWFRRFGAGRCVGTRR